MSCDQTPADHGSLLRTDASGTVAGATPLGRSSSVITVAYSALRKLWETPSSRGRASMSRSRYLPIPTSSSLDDDPSAYDMAEVQPRQEVESGAALKDPQKGKQHIREISTIDSIVSREDEPTEQEKLTLRRVADKLPKSAWLVAVIELCERFAYYGLSGPFQVSLQLGSMPVWALSPRDDC